MRRIRYDLLARLEDLGCLPEQLARAAVVPDEDLERLVRELEGIAWGPS